MSTGMFSYLGLRWCLLNAAGTPMTTPLPLSFLDKFTLLPGEFSMSSTSGRASPTCTKLLADEWKALRDAIRGAIAAKMRRVAYILMVVMFTRCCWCSLKVSLG